MATTQIAIAADEDLGLLIAGTFACDDMLAHAIGAAARVRDYPARATIVDFDAGANDVHLLAAGHARMVVNSIEGRLVVIEDYGVGDLFGVSAMFEPEASPAQVCAVTRSRTGAIAGHAFVAFMSNHVSIALAVSRMLVARLSASNRRVAENATLSANGRVHAELLRRARAGERMTVRPAPVLADFALSVQTTRETVSRAISALEKRGIVRRSADALTVVAPHRLEELVY